MSTTNIRLVLLLVAACFLFAGGCDDALDSVDETSTDVASLPPPPPPAGAPAPPPVVAPAEPEPVPQVVEQEPEEDVAEEAPPPTKISFHTEDQPPPVRALTPREAKSAVEVIGGRVSVNDSGQVVKVFLNRTAAGDDEMHAIQYLPELEILNLTGTSVSDAGLRHVHCLSKLKRIYAAHSEISNEGVRQLNQALPECEVFR